MATSVGRGESSLRVARGYLQFRHVDVAAVERAVTELLRAIRG
jgi:hypothetical protein